MSPTVTLKVKINFKLHQWTHSWSIAMWIEGMAINKIIWNCQWGGVSTGIECYHEWICPNYDCICFKYDWSGDVLNVNGFVLDTTGFVQNMTGVVLNMTDSFLLWLDLIITVLTVFIYLHPNQEAVEMHNALLLTCSPPPLLWNFYTKLFLVQATTCCAVHCWYTGPNTFCIQPQILGAGRRCW